MKKRHFLLIAVIALAGCGPDQPSAPAPERSTTEARSTAASGIIQTDQITTATIEGDEACAAFRSEDLHERCLALEQEQLMRNVNTLSNQTSGALITR